MRVMLNRMATVPAISILICAVSSTLYGSAIFLLGGDRMHAIVNVVMGVTLILSACFAFYTKARLAAFWREQAGTTGAPMVCLLLYPNSSVVTVPTNLAHYIPGVPDMTKNPQPYTFSPAHPHVDPYEWKLNEGTKE